MKKAINIILLGFTITTCFSQEADIDNVIYYLPKKVNEKSNLLISNEISFDIHGAYQRSVLKERLTNAKILDDITSDYPTNWVSDYVSTEISANVNGKLFKAKGTNQILTEDQKFILKNIMYGDDITIDVKYRNRNAANDHLDIMNMNFTLNVIPEKEAEFQGGRKLMRKYLDEHAISKLREFDARDLISCKIHFTVNEAGEITKTKITQSSGNEKTDALLIDSINKMPRWKPAENSKGTKVKQNFEFNLQKGMGNEGC